MALSNDDVHEILRIIDETPLDELTVETDGFSLHVRKSGTTDSSVRAHATDVPNAAGGGGVTIASPMIGVFYRAEGPGKKPFVDVGSRVEPDTIVCIIEAMKMMNSVTAGVAGTVVQICCENAEPVEYDTPLFRVEPA
jgi:acetyl-CoA carboxylase biotin carboxyl carrier protein